MKLLLGNLLLAGVCWLGAATNFPPMRNFNNRKLAGTWYPLAIIPIEIQFPQYTLRVESSRALSYNFKFRINDVCKPKKLTFTQQSVPGDFKTLSPAIVHIVDTDYNTYSISYVERGSDAFLTLASKVDSLTEALRTKFQEYATSAGVTGEMKPVIGTETC